ncbi:MAG: glycosyltransferase family 4 protein [Desulfobacterales bacterium]
MKILYLHQYFNTPKMPGGTRSFEMARRLVDSGHKVHMITSDRSHTATRRWYRTNEHGIQVHWLPVPYNNTMPYPDRIRAFLRYALNTGWYAGKFEADLVFATSTPLTIALPAIYLAKRRKIPMVFEVRDLWPELPIAVGAIKGPLILPAKWLERIAYRNSANIIALSPGMKDGIVRNGYRSDRVHVIPNSADIDMFSVPEAAGISFRKKYDWLQERPLAVYAGTLGRINGVEYLANLAKKVQSIDSEIRFLVVGNGREKQKVMTLAKKLNIFEKNFFMISSLPKKEMPKILSAANLVISLFINLPEMWANSANKFFDGLASGTAIAINYHGWQAKLLRETGAGIILDSTNTDLAAYQLTANIRNPKKMKDAGEAAHRLATEQFSRDILAKRLEKILSATVSAAKN